MLFPKIEIGALADNEAIATVWRPATYAEITAWLMMNKHRREKLIFEKRARIDPDTDFLQAVKSRIIVRAGHGVRDEI
jgi:hypothetical protein